jgi:predicted Zn-dependent peptidase
MISRLFEEARVEAGGAVDQDIDATEPVDRRPHGLFCLGAAGHVQRGAQQVVRRS